MFCTNCGTEYEGNFCPKCGQAANRVSETPVADNNHCYYDKDGDEIDLAVIYGLYPSRDKLIKFLRQGTEYGFDKITAITDYVIDNVQPKAFSFFEAQAMKKQIEDSLRRADIGENDPGLFQLKGTDGTVIAYEDRVVIRRKGFFAITTYGFKGDRTFFYNALSGIEYRKPGNLNGYMKFIAAGTPNIQRRIGLFASTTVTPHDENTVILRAFNPQTPSNADRMYALLMKKLSSFQK